MITALLDLDHGTTDRHRLIAAPRSEPASYVRKGGSPQGGPPFRRVLRCRRGARTPPCPSTPVSPPRCGRDSGPDRRGRGRARSGAVVVGIAPRVAGDDGVLLKHLWSALRFAHAKVRVIQQPCVGTTQSCGFVREATQGFGDGSRESGRTAARGAAERRAADAEPIGAPDTGHRTPGTGRAGHRPAPIPLRRRDGTLAFPPEDTLAFPGRHPGVPAGRHLAFPRERNRAEPGHNTSRSVPAGTSSDMIRASSAAIREHSGMT